MLGEKYITADIESPLAKIKMDIHAMPFAENSFDVVLCNHVLEHVQDDIQALREICRVLKPGGWSILQVPFFAPIPEVTIEDTSMVGPREREKALGQGDHVRKYGKDYSLRIARAGLKVFEEKFAFELSAERALRLGISPKEVLYKGDRKSAGRERV